MTSTPLPKTCQSCLRRPAIIKINGRWRCQVCLDKRNESKIVR
jgi:hypothetical protein